MLVRRIIRWLMQAKIPENEEHFELAKRGYDPVHVDAYLESVATDLERKALPADELRNKTFPIVKFGYDRVDVHRYLARLGTQIDRAA